MGVGDASHSVEGVRSDESLGGETTEIINGEVV
jgi:hypothetical protein